MKRCVLNILSIFLLLVIWVCTVLCFVVGKFYEAAEGANVPYAKIEGEVWLLDKESGRRIFLLPKTYYAVIDNIEGEYYYVTFNGVSGKVYKESVSVVGYHTTASGTVKEIKIDPKYIVFTEIKLKSTIEGKGEEYTVPTEESLFFLGKYPLDDMWYYVKYNEFCGYIKAEYTSEPDLVIPNFVPEKENSDITVAPVEEKEYNVTEILVVTGVCVAVVVVIIVIFLPKKKHTGKYYYEDTES